MLRVFELHIICTLTLLLAAGPSAASAQYREPRNVTVLLIDPHSGKPLKKVDVTMAAWNGQTDADTPATSIGKIDSEGKATFQMPQSAPRHISFALLYRNFEYCSPGTFSAEEVLATGVVDKYDGHCGKLRWHGAAKPGKVVIFARKLSFWDKILQESP